MRFEDKEILVTVVIPYYNNELTIVRALQSVIEQKFKDYEVILINDGSKDSSYEVVEKFLKENNELKNVKHINQKNMGPSKSRNVGIELASGKYIAFLDADDKWENVKLEKQICILENNKEIDMIGSNIYINSDNKIEKKYFVREEMRRVSFTNMLYKHFYATPTVVAKKDVLISCGMFKLEQHYMEDSLLFTKVCRDYNAYMMNDFFVHTYKNSFGESGLSREIDKMQMCELKNFCQLYKENSISKEKMSILKFICCYTFSLVKYFRRKVIVFFRK